MKILFQNRKKGYWIGGDYIQMEATAKALRKLGVEVDISEESVVSPVIIKRYDIVHLWNFSMPWTKYQLWVARKHKKPVVCSMIYHESDQFIPYNLQQIMLNELSAQIYLTKSEKERVARRLKPTGDTFVIPNGIDKKWFKRGKVPKEDIVLTVGRVEPNKGQLAVARACYRLKIPYYCAGEIQDINYSDQLKELGVHFLGTLDYKKLIKWYARAKILALISKAEIFPLTVMEAMAQNCEIILTTTSEWKPNVWYADFNDEKQIEDTIKKVIKIKIKRKYDSLVTWDIIAQEIKKIYEGIR